uniref:PH domain-containing protein n=1 Tax=Labrus bergylta TaxID=56723 RepID=A0A3Q3FJ55_9LABR
KTEKGGGRKKEGADREGTVREQRSRECDGKVQAFGKRCQAAKRDPNCPVVIRGWLNKKDSSGLKLWKRRWFVLSNYCLFYYKDSREESVLGSIPLPSYKILFCTPRECKNRKFTFKVPSVWGGLTFDLTMTWCRRLCSTRLPRLTWSSNPHLPLQSQRGGRT